MRRNISLLLVLAVFAFEAAFATPVTESQLVGAKKCTWGPSYWCHNFGNAKDCKAVSHCIDTVWQRQEVPEDNDSICQICKDMVTQARDQLRSNETMEELKEVFEGSCNLIPIKIVRKDCCKLADNFVPELVEALSSQMNPDQVCSVAGLCNNADIDRLLNEYYTKALSGTLPDEEDSSEEKEKNAPLETQAVGPKLTCGTCNHFTSVMVEKFTSTNRDEILENILHLCGEMSSFSDACANIALIYFNDIYEHLKKNIEAPGICHVSGVCSYKYHQHAEDTSAEEDDMAAVAALHGGGDDIPCELCQQLVRHLRDVLVANTTEIEFKQVLEGLCKQSKGFKDECLSIVDQYYDVIYKALTTELDPNSACFMIGVCPKGKQSRIEGEIRPLLSVFPPAEIKVTIRKKLGSSEPKFTAEDIHSMALPMDTLMGAANPGLLVDSGKLCTICEYALHFIQESLATPATEDEIKKTVSEICDKGPKSIRGQCHNFIDEYGDAVIALLIQGLNPREVCPKLQMCPQNHELHDDMEVFSPIAIDYFEDNKPTCPLCVFAVEEAQKKIKDDKSKANIENVLDHLCVHLPNKLRKECEDFVKTYSSELIDMLITDFKPQEICLSLKLCDKESTYLDDMSITLEDSKEDSSEESYVLNEIDTSDEMPVKISFSQHEDNTPNCLLCIELVKIVEKRIKTHTTKEEIKRALEQSCGKLRKNMQHECHKIVDKYGDKIASLVLQQMAPKLICRELAMCLFSEKEDLDIDEALKYDVIVMPNANVQIMSGGSITMENTPNCVLCEFVMTKLESELKNNKTQDEIKHTIEKICHLMPNTIEKKCDSFIEQYGNVVFALLSSMPPKEICQNLMLCSHSEPSFDKIITEDVEECGVCHGATISLLPFFKQHLDQTVIDTQDMIAAGCESVPAKYFQRCSSMISIYGKSILHLSQNDDVDEAHICAEIGKCLKSEESSLAFARISA